SVIGDPLTDTSLRQFRTNTILSFGFSIYNAKSSAGKPPSLSSQIRLFKDGVPQFTGEVHPVVLTGQTDMKAIGFMSSLVLGTAMTAVDYILEVAVTDSNVKGTIRTATHYIPFEIVD